MSSPPKLHAKAEPRDDLSVCGMYGISTFAQSPDEITCRRCLKTLSLRTP